MSLGQTLSRFWYSVQAGLLPWLEDELGPLGERYRRLVTVLEFVRVKAFLPHFHDLSGRPQGGFLLCHFSVKHNEFPIWAGLPPRALMGMPRDERRFIAGGPATP